MPCVLGSPTPRSLSTSSRQPEAWLLMPHFLGRNLKGTDPMVQGCKVFRDLAAPRRTQKGRVSPTASVADAVLLGSQHAARMTASLGLGSGWALLCTHRCRARQLTEVLMADF